MTLYHDLVVDCDKRLGKATPPVVNYRLATPSTQLNCALGMGLPGGSIIEVIGEPGSFKTSTVASWGACVQRLGGFVWFADAEHKFDFPLGEKVGLTYHPDHWHYSQPAHLEGWMTVLDDWLKRISLAQSREPMGSSLPVMLVLDSIAMLGMAAISKDRMDKAHQRPMNLAQCWNSYLQRQAPKLLCGTNIYVVLLNHVRDNVDMQGYGNRPEFKSPGGRMIKHAEKLRVFVKTTKLCKSNEDWFEEFETRDSDYGKMVHYYVEKNSTCPDGRAARIPFLFHKGFDDALASLQYLKDQKVVEYRGGYIIGDWKFKSFRDLLRETMENLDFARMLQNMTAQVYQERNFYTAEDFALGE